MLQDIIGGISSGIAQVIIMMPFDLVKVRIQQDSKLAPRYQGPLNCFTTIIKDEGYAAFYKGVETPLIGYSILSGIQFGVNKFFQQMYSKYQENGRLEVKYCAISGAAAGIATSLISSPVELARLKMQIPEKGLQFKGSLDALKQIYSRYGVKKVYLGYCPTLMRQIVGYAAYFSYYKKAMETVDQKNRLIWSLFHGGIAGLANWMLAYPFDVIKSCVQNDSLQQPSIPTFRHAFRKCTQGSLLNLYRGYSVVIVRAFPTNAGGFLAYELALSWIKIDPVQ